MGHYFQLFLELGPAEMWAFCIDTMGKYIMVIINPYLVL